MQKSLYDLSDNEYDEIKKMAAVFFTPKQIAIVLELNIDEFVDACNNTESKCFIAFEGSRLKSEFELNSSIVRLAKSGSSPAQTMALEMYRKSQLKLNER